jgi:isopentenyldiphosphate isomerase
MSESLDVLNAAGLPTGVLKARAQVHRDGDLHRTFHLWIVREGRSVLLQRRAQGKDLEPGKLDVAVGGHFGAGETLAEVLREVEEELGFSVRLGELEYLTTTHALREYEGIQDNELQETYLLRRDTPLESYVLDPTEVEVLYELPLEGAVALFRDGTPLAVAGHDAYGRQNNALLVADDLIEQARGEVVARLEQIQALLAVPAQ